MRPVICLIQRLYVRLHGSKVRVDRRTLLRVLHYSFQNASSARCRAALKERLAADTLRTSHSYKCRSTSMINQSSSKRAKSTVDRWFMTKIFLSLFQFSLSFQLFRMMKFYSFLVGVVLNMAEEASKKVYVSDIVVYWKYNYLFVVQRIFLFARFSIFKEKFLLPFVLLLHFYRDCISSCTPLRWRYL